jgi:hypothetical protein
VLPVPNESKIRKEDKEKLKDLNAALAVRIGQIIMDLITKCYCIGPAFIHFPKSKNVPHSIFS